MYTHKQLAEIWITYNGLKITEKRIQQTLKTPFEFLLRMLKERNLIN
jgi:hypothetical protein